jgi:hypothetical protein
LDFKNLYYLNLGYNNIKKIPVEIETLPLRYLILEYTKITKLPESICNISTLETLNIQCDNLLELPENLVQLKNLRVLSLTRQAVIQNLHIIKNIPNLAYLYIYDKQNTFYTAQHYRYIEPKIVNELKHLLLYINELFYV